jgi:signal transduction histidine kinase
MSSKRTVNDSELTLESQSLTKTGGTTVEAMSSRLRLIAKANHDLRNPIQVIITWATILEKQLEAQGLQDRRALETIKRAASRLTVLADQMLEISRIDGGAIEDVTVSDAKK